MTQNKLNIFLIEKPGVDMFSKDYWCTKFMFSLYSSSVKEDIKGSLPKHTNF